jgi:hypothetical protein
MHAKGKVDAHVLDKDQSDALRGVNSSIRIMQMRASFSLGVCGECVLRPRLADGMDLGSDCASGMNGLTPDIADTSEKADNGRGGVSCQKEENTRRSSNVKQLPWRTSQA